MGKSRLFILGVLVALCSCVSTSKRDATMTENEGFDSYLCSLDSIPTDSVEVNTSVSEDGNMTFYSWNTGLGGTSPRFAVICQYRTKEGKEVTFNFGNYWEGDDPAYVADVHSIKKDDGSTYYITTRYYKASSNDCYMWMDGFVIDHDTLKRVSVLDGEDDYEKDDLSVNFLMGHINWDWLFKYDAQTRNLYVPQTDEEDGTVPNLNGKYRLYHFDGMKFVDKGEIEPPFDE